jgi:ribosome-associated toxin RatA of RatAB toxin-antitoxin module
MPIVHDAILIDAPSEDLFALSQDYSLRRAWDPFVREMRFLDGTTEPGIGVRVWVRAWTGLTMEVVFVSFNPPRSVAMKILHGPWFLKKFAGVWLFTPFGEAKTEVAFRYSFATTGGWFGRLMEPFIGWLFWRDVRARLRGLKRGAEQLGLLDRLKEPCR